MYYPLPQLLQDALPCPGCCLLRQTYRDIAGAQDIVRCAWCHRVLKRGMTHKQLLHIGEAPPAVMDRTAPGKDRFTF